MGKELPKRPSMKFKNSTDYPDSFLRKMVTWVCRELEVPKGALRSLNFMNTSACYSGVCFTRTGEVIFRIGSARHFPVKETRDVEGFVLQDRIEALINITAHELQHVFQGRKGLVGNYQRVERPARMAGYRCVMAFRADRAALLEYWQKHRRQSAVSKGIQGARPSIKERNRRKAEEALKRWETKLKRAQSKVKTYRTKVRYYQRQDEAK